MADSLGKFSSMDEWVVICRVPNEESAYLYFFLELFEGIFNYSTLDPEPGSKTRDLVAITNSTLLPEARELIEDLKTSLRLQIIEDFKPVPPTTIVK